MARRRVRAALGLLPAIVAALALLAFTPGTARGEAELESARSHFERGRQLEESGDLPAALDAYQRAQQLRPIFRLHRHIGRVLRHLGRLREALEHYRAFLEGGDRADPGRRQQVIEAIEELEAALTRVHLTAPEGATILLDGQELAVAPVERPLQLDPGHAILEVQLEGHRPFRQELVLERGAVVHVHAQLTPVEAPEPTEAPEPPPVEEEPDAVEEAPPPAPRDRRPLGPGAFWITAGLAAATLVAGGVLGVLALVEEDRFEELNVPTRPPEQDVPLRESRDRGEALSLSADLLFGLGGAAAVAALVLAFFTDFDNHDDEQSARLLIGVGVIGARGSF